ncbi:lactoylglutathione lyase [Acetobacter pomorum]|uniref:Aldoketomutase n=1 Tax=Acetobacter pomorum TaxID=65959 RepID=A0A2G4REX1_9PROT|nr:VOC family protein [Acetobacter pomorum]PHY95116.1 lactoylglutathione lyase [Acetobacter pomorum]GBR52139.1 lactoylglutathione lyase [Acetobacter pomorum DSM 11825]
MAKMIHTMLRVLDEARSLKFYAETLGLKPVDRFEFESFTLVYLANDEQSFELELTINHGRTEPYAQGEGYGHLAVSVADVSAEHARMEAAGHPVTPVKTLENKGRIVGQFFFLADPDGYKIEVLQRGAPGRFL